VPRYRYISADSHLEISPEKWRHRVPLKYRDRAPRVIKTADGGDAVLIENRPLNIFNAPAHGGGIPPEKWGEEMVVHFDELLGGGLPEQRLREQDQDGIDAEVLFADVAGRADWSAVSDDDTYHAIVCAYNEWLAEEYCAVNPRRLIGMGVMPERGADKAIKEMEHCAKLGLKGINLGTWPNGSPDAKLTPGDDRFWSAAIDLNMPVTIHSSFRESTPGQGFARGGARTLVTRMERAAHLPVDLVADGVFDRFPGLQIYVAETEIGWLPHFLERMDILHAKSHFSLERRGVLKPLSRPPSEIIKDHWLWGFINDPLVL
jgi:predicted TIM-barrel fold metal-dependent hydrolase